MGFRVKGSLRPQTQHGSVIKFRVGAGAFQGRRASRASGPGTLYQGPTQLAVIAVMAILPLLSTTTFVIVILS